MEKLPHLDLIGAHETLAYTGMSGGASKPHVARNRAEHARFLHTQLLRAWSKATSEQIVTIEAKKGNYLEFVGAPDADLATKSLEDLSSKKIRLLNVREVINEDEQIVTCATVYVDNDKKEHFINKIVEYQNENTRGGNPKNEPLITSISDIKAALLDSFWTDDIDLKPGEQKQWIEVWLRANSEEELEQLSQVLEKLEVNAKSSHLLFPERAVRVIYANAEDLIKLINTCDLIAEYRLAKTPASFFMDMDRADQQEWLEELVGRVETKVSSQSSVCILDTGVNNAHPLLAPFLPSSDCQAVNPSWGVNDIRNHGTLMAGTALYGDLNHHLSGSHSIVPTHFLESVKILPDSGANEPNLWGAITSQAVSRAEIQQPYKNRTFCMAVAATDTRDKGKPSSWSAEIDQLAAQSGEQRLFVVCAGNAVEEVCLNQAATNYPNVQLHESVHDPAQAWNALTVGAVTNLINITEPYLSGYTPVAQNNELSPFTTTSTSWEDNKWPIKPELVLEGGNLALNSAGFATESDDLSLLSTAYKPSEQGYFFPFNMTSAATAQLAKMAGAIRAQYPDYWEETVRALLVHSAQWPAALKEQFIGASTTKADYQHLLSICGYGVPSLERALYSANNSLTLIAQAELQPFYKERSEYKTKDMHFYALPWPKDVLQTLPDNTQVRMKVTLSYFIEPGPGEIGWKDRYRYASHALRFEVNNPNESQEEFLSRMNKEERPDEYDSDSALSTAGHWQLGSTARNRGSIHSDIWLGTSAELAASNLIAITPVIGWWRERPHLGRWDSKTRYSLIVSIETEDASVDVYTPVAQQIRTQVSVLV